MLTYDDCLDALGPGVVAGISSSLRPEDWRNGGYWPSGGGGEQGEGVPRPVLGGGEG